MNLASRARVLLVAILTIALLVGYTAMPVLAGGVGPSEDYVVADADGAVPVANTGSLFMGAICQNREYKFNVLVAANREHLAPTGGWGDSAVLTFSTPTVNGTGLSATWPASPGNQVTLPSNWRASPDGTKSDYITSEVTLVASSLGQYAGSFGYGASGAGAISGSFTNGGALNIFADVYECPAITITTPADGATYVAGSNVLADYSCTTETSAIVFCQNESESGGVPNGQPIDTSTIGSKSFTVSGSTEAGGTDSKTVHYRVVYPFQFIEPTYELPGPARQVVAGPKYKVRFSLDGYHGKSVLKGWPRQHRVNCETGKVMSRLSTSGIARPRYRAAKDQYVVVWDTKASWAGQCRTFVVRLRDGTRHTAKFEFVNP